MPYLRMRNKAWVLWRGLVLVIVLSGASCQGQADSSANRSADAQQARPLLVNFVSAPFALQNIPIYTLDATRGAFIATTDKFNASAYERIRAYGHGSYRSGGQVHDWVRIQLNPVERFIIIEGGSLRIDDHDALVDPTYTTNVRASCPAMTMSERRLVPSRWLDKGAHVFLFTELRMPQGQDSMSRAYGEYNQPYLSVGLADNGYTHQLWWVPATCLEHPSPWILDAANMLSSEAFGPSSEFRDALLAWLFPEQEHTSNQNLLASHQEQMRRGGERCQDILKGWDSPIYARMHNQAQGDTTEIPTVAVFLCSDRSPDSSAARQYAMAPKEIFVPRRLGAQVLDMLVVNFSPNTNGVAAPAVAFGSREPVDHAKVTKMAFRPAFWQAPQDLDQNVILVAPGIENAVWVELTSALDRDLSGFLYASGQYQVPAGGQSRPTLGRWSTYSVVTGEVLQD